MILGEGSFYEIIKAILIDLDSTFFFLLLYFLWLMWPGKQQGSGTTPHLYIKNRNWIETKNTWSRILQAILGPDFKEGEEYLGTVCDLVPRKAVC